MAENSENIEARLCAYVEGDLDEAGRVEIEKHLQAHPNHRRLLTELMATRDLLRYLPREQAPPELAETFTAHLERAALLDGPSGGGDAAGRSLRGGNFLPRMMAAAAIVVLGSGLFAIVYFSLPRGESGTRIAMPTDVTTRPLDEGLLADAGKGGGGEGGAAASNPAPLRRERMGKMAPRPGGPTADAKFGSHDAFAEEPRKGGNIADRRSAKGGSIDKVFDSGAADPVYLVVSADKLDAAVRDVKDNLSNNSIVWESASESAPLPLRLQNNQVALNSARNSTQVAQLELSNALSKKQQYGYNRQSQVPSAQYNKDASADSGQKQSEDVLDRTYAARTADLETNANVAVQQKSEGETQSGNKVGEAAGVSPPDGAVPAETAQARSTATELATAEQPKSEKSAAPPPAAAPAEPSVVQDKRLAKSKAATTAPSDALATRQELTPPQSPQVGAQQLQEEGQEPQPIAEGDVVAINAYGVTRRQVVELSRVLNRADQQVELIAEDKQLQQANQALQRSLSDRFTATDAAAQSDEVFHAKPDSAPHAASKSDTSPAPAPATELAEAPQPPAAAETEVHGKVSSRVGKGPRPPVIRPGMELYITVDELKGPDTDATTQRRVADDGTVQLPQLDEPVRVTGLTRPEAARAIADAYRKAQVIDKPTVAVEPVADAGPLAPIASKAPPAESQAAAADTEKESTELPTVEPRERAMKPSAREVEAASGEAKTNEGQQLTQAAATRPRLIAGGRQRPTTGATAQGSLTDGADERLDVVILVQRNSATPLGDEAVRFDALETPVATPGEEAEAAKESANTAPAESESPSDPAAPAEPTQK